MVGWRNGPGLLNTCFQSRELERLGHLRETYLQRISQKLRNRRESAGLGASEERDALSPDKRELIFLEKNLEELTRAHKKVSGKGEGRERGREGGREGGRVNWFCLADCFRECGVAEGNPQAAEHAEQQGQACWRA